MFKSGLAIWMTALCGLVLSGCETLDRTVDTADVAGISRIGVVSGLRDEMHHIYVSANFFKNAWSVRLVPEWDMPGFAEASLASALEKAANLIEVGIVDVTGLDRRSFEENKAGLLAAAKAQGFDAVALILPMWPVRESAFVPGFGVLHAESFGFVNHCVYQETVVYVLDVVTGKQLAWQHGYNVWDGSCQDSSVPFKADVGTYTAAEMEKLAQEIRAAFDFGFERAVRKLGFGAARGRPSPGGLSG